MWYRWRSSKSDMIGRIITLTPEDDVTSIKDRLEWANADRVLLVTSSTLRRELDLARLQRLQQQTGTQIGIVSSSQQLRHMAKEIGLVAFSSIEQAQRSLWIASSDIEPIARLEPARRFVPNSLQRFFPQSHVVTQGMRLLAMLLVAGTLGGAALVIVPTAKINMTASRQLISRIVPVTLNMRADKVDLDAQEIPAQRVDVVVEDSLNTPTTGSKDVQRFKAGGRVVFFNNTVAEFEVRKGTVVRTSNTSKPVRFATLVAVKVPPNGQAVSDIEAIEPGPLSNVGPDTINQVEGIAGLSVRTTNPNGTGGGGGDSVRSVTRDDYARARQELRAKLFDVAWAQMQQKREIVDNGLFIVPDSFFIADVQDETYDRFMGEQAESLNLSMRIQVSAIVIAPEDLNAVASNALQSSVPEGFSLLAASAERGEVVEEGTGIRTVYYINARGMAGAQIDKTLERRLVRGKSVPEAQRILQGNFSLSQAPQISIQPAWVARILNRLPFVSLRIEPEVIRE